MSPRTPASPSPSDRDAPATADRSDWRSPPWNAVADGLSKRFRKRPLGRVFGTPKSSGDSAAALLRAGLAIAHRSPLSPLQTVLGDLAAGVAPRRRLVASIDWEAAAEEELLWIDDLASPGKVDPVSVANALLWAYALPPLVHRLSEPTWKRICQSLDALVRHCLADVDPPSVGRLLGGELALVLRLRLADFASSDAAESAVERLLQWSDASESAVDAAIRDSGRYGRLTLASLYRQTRLAKSVADRKIKKRDLGPVIDLACWVAALCRRDGTTALSSLTKVAVRDDVAPGSLFDLVRSLSPKMLNPAYDAALGRGQSGGRVAWQISLPESLWHSETAGLAALLPEWDIRRGRIYIDYRGEAFRIEVEYGSGPAIGGVWETLIDVDGVDQAPAGPWCSICEYSDDDAQYLEFEQRWTGGVRLQRQLMLLREDRCVLLADAVLRDPELPPARIGYVSRLPIGESLEARPDPETTEIWLVDAAGKRRALALSLRSSEWRVGPSAATLEVTPDRHLRLQTASQPPCDNGGGLFAPLWFDFQPRRFDRPRTFRQLTVADELRIVDADEAVAHRVQLGSEQWVIYRSLRGERNRTFLGKHLLADFYAARFHAGEGEMEDMLTVGERDEAAADSR